jgi:hypothetical protein
VTGSSSLAKLLFLLLSGTFSHAGGPTHQLAFAAKPPAAQTAIRRTFRARPTGEWFVGGRVVAAHNVADRTKGELLQRKWRFETQCDGGKCETLFWRTMSDGRGRRSILTPHAGFYSAEFPYLPSTCEVTAGEIESFTGHFRIWWSKGRHSLLAEETGGIPATSVCPGSYEKIIWVAHRHFGSTSEGAGDVL